MEYNNFLIQLIRRDYPEHAKTEVADAQMQSLIHTYVALYEIAMKHAIEDTSSPQENAVNAYFDMLTSKFSEKRLRSQIEKLTLQVSSLQKRLDALENK